MSQSIAIGVKDVSGEWVTVRGQDEDGNNNYGRSPASNEAHAFSDLPEAMEFIAMYGRTTDRPVEILDEE